MTIIGSPDQQEDRLRSLSGVYERIMIISMDTYQELCKDGGKNLILDERATGTVEFIEVTLNWTKMKAEHKERVVTSPIIPTFLPNGEMLSPE